MPKGKYRRLENGFGSVVKLSGNRRRPYAARLSASGTANGQNTPRAIGYYETWQQAYDALAEYNKLASGDMRNMTFKDVFDMLMRRKTEPPHPISKSRQIGMTSAIKRCSALYDTPISLIRLPELQRIMDATCADVGPGTCSTLKNVLHQMWTLADEYDLVRKNYASFLQIKQPMVFEHSEAFTRAEVDKMWINSDDDSVARILIMIYSGFRIAEYKTMMIDTEQRIFQGGSKTTAGKNRIVPMHSRIVPLVERLVSADDLLFKNDVLTRRRFPKTLESIGIDVKNHTPHDCRATFASLLSAAGAPDLHIKRMMGHASGDLTKDVYTSVEIELLRQSLELIL